MFRMSAEVVNAQGHCSHVLPGLPGYNLEPRNCLTECMRRRIFCLESFMLNGQNVRGQFLGSCSVPNFETTRV